MAWFLRQDNLDRTLPYTSELEKVGFFLAAIGATLAAVSNIAEDGFHIPLTGWVFIASIFSLLIGVLLLAIATLAANVLPRWYGWALLVGLLGLLLNDHLLPEGGGFMLFGLVWLVLGYALLKDQTRMPVPSERIHQETLLHTGEGRRFSKLQVADRAQAVIRAREAGLGYSKTEG